ncbi:hypothetical protein JZ751_005610 [Albula glossodonta]|uniref:Uncharacterized protein n=1 Tax=Albula glossodonta TaxID=121402 RepID=A0A8T2NBK2_9TELE|nr:hypothetical protein JZ751_005610 [Albula glossodonta]
MNRTLEPVGTDHLQRHQSNTILRNGFSHLPSEVQMDVAEWAVSDALSSCKDHTTEHSTVSQMDELEQSKSMNKDTPLVGNAAHCPPPVYRVNVLNGAGGFWEWAGLVQAVFWAVGWHRPDSVLGSVGQGRKGKVFEDGSLAVYTVVCSEQ